MDNTLRGRNVGLHNSQAAIRVEFPGMASLLKWGLLLWEIREAVGTFHFWLGAFRKVPFSKTETKGPESKFR
jgi:hypothetical protein